MNQSEKSGDKMSTFKFPDDIGETAGHDSKKDIYLDNPHAELHTELELQKKIINALKENQQYLSRQYQHFLQLTDTSFLSIDRQGLIIDCNRIAAKILNTVPALLANKLFTDLLHEDEVPVFNTWLEKAWMVNTDLYLPVRLKQLQHGKLVTIEVKVFTSLEDSIAKLYISLQQSEEQLRKKESEEKYRSLIEQAYEGVLIYDLTGSILEFNDKAHNYLGYTRGEFERLSLMDLFYQEDMIKKPIVFTRLKEGKPVVDNRTMKRKDGTGIEMELNSKMMPDGSIIVFGRDITQRITAQREMQRLSKIIQNSRDEIFLVNPQTMLFEYANDAALNSLGYTAKEFYVMVPAAITENISLQQLQEMLLPLTTGRQEKVSFEFVHKRKDQSKYPAEVFIQLIDIGNREVFLWNARDISEKKKAAVELAKKEKYFRTLIEHSSSAIILFDEKGNFIYQSPVVEKIVGYKLGETERSNLLSFIHPDDEGLFKQKLQEVLVSPGATIKGQYRFRHQQGHYVWLEGSVTNLLDIEYIHALIANYQDISERKEAEERVKAERVLLRTLIDNLPDPIYVKDLAGKKIIANKEDQLFMGLESEEEALGKTDIELYPGKEGVASHETDIQIMARDITFNDWEDLRQDRSGKEHWLMSSKIPLHNSEGKVIGLLGIGRDITARKQMEDDLVKSNERYQYVMRATFDAVWDWDIPASKVYRGEGFETLFGYDLKATNGYIGEWDQLIHPDDLNRVLNSFKTALETNAINWQNEYKYKKANGEYAYVIDKAIIIRNNTGKAMRMVGAMQDITKQKAIQQQLEETEARFRALVENSADGIAILKQDGHLSYVSPSLQRILGYSMEEAKDLDAYKVTHPDDLEEVLKVYEFALEHPAEPVKGFTSRMLHKDGSWRWVEDTITNMLHVPAIEGFIENFRDVTEKLLIEKKIIAEKELSDSLINNLPGIFFQITNGRLSRWNKNFELLSGYSADEIAEILPLDFFVEEDKQKAAAFFSQSQKENTIVTELSFYTKEKEAIPFYVNAITMPVNHADGIIVMGFDIRERKEREERLRISNERFEYVTKATFDAIWDWDVANKELFWGENFHKYYGHDPASGTVNLVIWNNNIHPDDFERVSISIDKVIAGPDNIWVEQYRFKRSNGEYSHVQDRGVAIRDNSGKAIRMIGAMHDVTEQKKDEEKVRLLNQELASKAFALSSSNNELEKFAYVASHDLQEPLRMISSFLQLLKRKYQPHLDETAGKYIHFAVDGANRMKTLINDLLEYSRVSTAKGATGNTDMNVVMNEVRQIFMISLEETGGVIKNDKLPVLPGTRKLLMIQLMQNLVGNALKYHGEQPPEIKITAKDLGKEWLFSVADNGIGIDPAFDEKIFVIFQRLHNKDEFSGTGIGLSICKKIVEMHGGRIWVEPNENGGSIFNFTISKTVQL